MLKVDMNIWKKSAQDRQKWRQIVEAAKTYNVGVGITLIL